MSGMVLDVVGVDHCYAKPWSAHPDASNARPLRFLFMEKFPRNRTLEQSMPEPDIPLDVVSVSNTTVPTYDVNKGKIIMNECEKHVSGLRDNQSEDWEDKINRTGWSPQQNRLFNKINKILHSDRLARLAFDNNLNEPVLRRIHVDKTARRIRQTLGSFGWDTKLIQWLHGVLTENLTVALLCYLDALQTLKAKIPHLIDRMTAGVGLTPRSQAMSGEQLQNLIKRPWDPVLNIYSQNKLRKLPGNPLILVSPSGPTSGNNNLQTKRMRYWNSQLSSLGKVIPVTMHTVNGGSGVSIAQCLEHMIVAVKTKVTELKGHFANRPIVLMGWNIGALVACHVALQEAVSAVVCLGFPYWGVGGARGDVDDSLLDSRTPSLFVIGQQASTCSIDDMEDLREKMKAENSLVVVGGADDQLRVSRAKKKQEGITQVMADKTILDEVSEFLGGILSQGMMVQESVIVDISDVNGRKRRKSQLDTDELDGLDLVQTKSAATPHGLTIAQALRARAAANSASATAFHSYGSVVPSPIKVKRKYTKRKGVTKTAPAPRKRFRSTPTPPVASPVTNIQSPMSAGPIASSAGMTDLTTLFKAQPGMLSQFKVVTDQTGQKTASFSPITATTQVRHPPASSTGLSNQPLLSGLEEPFAPHCHQVYKLDESGKKKAPQTSDSSDKKATLSIESLLQSSSTLVKNPIGLVATSHPSLVQFSRQAPPVHITTASTVATQIHQLLSSMSRSSTTGITPITASSLPTASLQPNLPSTVQTTFTQSAAPTHQISQPNTTTTHAGTLTQAQISQSGSPLQNSVPTLMSSLTKTSSFNVGNVIKIITSTSSPTDPSTPLKCDEKKIAVRELTFSSQSTNADITSGEEETAGCDNEGENPDSDIISVTEGAGLPMSTTQKVLNPLCQIMSASPVTASTQKPLVSIPQTETSVSTYTTAVPTIAGDNQAGYEVETLGKVSSLLESSPVTERLVTVNVTPGSASYRTHTVGGVSVNVVTASQRTVTHRAAPNMSTTYTATPKPSMGTLASTRTRRIRTPKQYDL